MVAPLDVAPISASPVLLFTDKVSSCGITWFFDQEYQVGFFVNGDPWVKGPIQIIDISPCPKKVTFPGTNIKIDLNGTEVNPDASQNKQGLDGLARAGQHTTTEDYKGRVQYDVNLNKGLALPFTVVGDALGESVVSCESYPIIERLTKDWPRIQKVGILTVYPTDHSSGFPNPTGSMSGNPYPSENMFRPPYAKYRGTFAPYQQPSTYEFFLSGSLVDSEHRSGMLVTPTGIPNITGLANAYACVRLDHCLIDKWDFPNHNAVTDNASLYNDTQTPMQSQDIARNIGNAALIYHCSGTGSTIINGYNGWEASDPAFRDLKIGVIQRGIDVLGVVEQYLSGSYQGRWWPTRRTGPMFPFSAKFGKEANHGRLFELLFAAYLLSGNSRMHQAYSGVNWQEDEQTFVIDSNTIRVGQNYATGMTGTFEWGVLHSGAPSLDNAHYRSPSQWRNERADVVSTWWGQTLGAKICGMNYGAAAPRGGGVWDHEPYFGYMARHGNFLGTGLQHPSGDAGLGGQATNSEIAYDQWAYDMWLEHKDSFY